MKNTKKAAPLFLHGAYIVALFCLLGLSVIILWNNSVAWFANNKKVGASGASVTLKDLGIEDKYFFARSNKEAEGGYDAYAEITTWDHIFEKLSPGESVKIKAEYSCTSDINGKITVYFENLNGSDIPLTKTVGGETRYYYLGTQLKITEVTFSSKLSDAASDTAPTPLSGALATDSPIGKFLTESPVTDANKVTYHLTEKNPQKIELGSFTSTPSTTYAVEFIVEFINYPDIDQNDYQGYGWREDGTTEGIENCLRQVVAYIEE